MKFRYFVTIQQDIDDGVNLYRNTTTWKSPLLFKNSVYVRKSQHLHWISQTLNSSSTPLSFQALKACYHNKVCAARIFTCWLSFVVNLKAHKWSNNILARTISPVTNSIQCSRNKRAVTPTKITNIEFYWVLISPGLIENKVITAEKANNLYNHYPTTHTPN